MFKPLVVSQAAIQCVCPLVPASWAGHSASGNALPMPSGTARAHLTGPCEESGIWVVSLRVFVQDLLGQWPKAWWRRWGKSPFRKPPGGQVSVSVLPTCEEESEEIGCCLVLVWRGVSLRIWWQRARQMFVPSALTTRLLACSFCMI